MSSMSLIFGALSRSHDHSVLGQGQLSSTMVCPETRPAYRPLKLMSPPKSSVEMVSFDEIVWQMNLSAIWHLVMGSIVKVSVRA